MSYILEALQKSEAARRHSADATRLSLLPADGEPMPSRHLPHYALFAGLVLLNAALLYSRPGAAPGASVPAAPPQGVTKPIGPRSVAPQASAEPAPLQPFVAAEVTPPVRARPHSAQAEAPPARPSAPATPPAAAPESGMRTQSAARVPRQAADGANPAEMPPDIRQQLPPLAIAGFIRNAGAKDMVIVNDRLLHEGDEVEPGLRLEQILGDGLVFSYKGFRFKR